MCNSANFSLSDGYSAALKGFTPHVFDPWQLADHLGREGQCGARSRFSENNTI